MKRIKAKLLAGLLSVCACVCLAVGVAVNVPVDTAITASADTTYTINKLGGLSSSEATFINATSLEGDTPGVDSWDYAFTFEEGTGEGFLWNGEAITDWEIKQPGTDFYIKLGERTAVAGDEIVLDGAFSNATAGAKFVFNNCGLRYNGTTWESFTPPTVHNVGELALHVNSTVGGAKGLNNTLYLQRADGAALPILSWDYEFVYESGDGFMVNGVQKTPSQIASTGDGFYWKFDEVEAGSTVSIGGTFFCESQNVKYVIKESCFQWSGSAWSKITPATVHHVGELALHVNSTVGGAKGLNDTLYLQRADGEALPILSWDDVFTYESGNGFMVNGVQKTPSQIKSTGDGFYWKFDGVEAGSTVSIGGTFFCESQNVKYVIEESHFQWSGSSWSVYEPATQHTLGAMVVNTPSNNGTASTRADHLYLKRADGGALPYPDGEWSTIFTLKSGEGLKVNGNSATLGEMKSTDAGLFLSFAAVNAGDVVSISGTFYCDKEHAEYIIEESTFEWTGSIWKDCVVYNTFKIGKVVIGNGSSASAVYFDKASGAAFEVVDGTWEEKLTYESGLGVTLNGTQIAMGDIKIPNNLYVGLGTTAKNGDVLAIGGTFYNETLAVKYVIEESHFQWNGSAWVEYVAPIEHNIGALELHANSTIGNAKENNAVLYLQRADGETLPIQLWENPFVLESGDGLKVNGNSAELKEMQSTEAGLYLLFDALNAGDVLSLSGTYFCEKQNVKYIISESKFIWNGLFWEVYGAYTTYEVGKVLMTNSSSATAVYFYREDGNGFAVTDDTWEERLTFFAGSGVGVTLNGNAIDMDDIKIPNNLYVALGTTAKNGDVLVIGGTFYNVNLKVKYVITESVFTFNGTKWFSICDETQLAAYDEVTIMRLGWGTEKTLTGTCDGAGLSYIPSAENTTGSVKFRFGYESTDLSQGQLAIRLRGGAWEGIHFRLIWNGIDDVDGTLGMGLLPLNNNQYYIIEIAAIDTVDGNYIWVYLTIDGVMQFSTKVAKDETYAAYNTNHVSIYADNVAESMISDPDHVAITYTTNFGTFVDYAERNGAYTLISGRTYDTFIGWAADGVLYEAGATIENIDSSLSFTAVSIKFFLEEGAAIRLADSANESGIRFTTYINEAELNALSAYGIRVLSYGTLIVPFDYLGAGQMPNLNDFTPDEDILKIDSTYDEVVDGYVVYRGAMKKLNEDNYTRVFAGRGYMEISVNGETRIIYTDFDFEDNVRSIRYVAQQFKADMSEAIDGELRYADLSDTKKAIVDNYAASDSIELMKYDAYKANNFLNLIAWYYPELDSSNAYNNATNIAIAQKIKDAGMKAVYLDGKYHLNLDTNENVEKTRQIINFFWSQGLYTIAFGSNAGTNCYIDYSEKSYPDFSDCEGFIGFLVWDEPSGTENIDKLAVFANNFETLYAGTDVTFMVNLLPSYASLFNGTTNWWESSLDSLDKEAYKAYMQKYCETVLSQLDGGQKWLSLDSYPINADESLTPNFLFDLAMLKYYAETNGAHSHVALQSSGWIENGNKTKDRMPTEAEMRMQAYAAMAFGIDSLSWWSYSDMREDDQSNPTDRDEYYTRFANVNNELNAIGHIYSAFDWKGVILGAGKDNGNIFNEDADYEAFNAVKGQIGDYELSASDTKHLASVSTDKTNWNYLMGVMQDMNGNEGYVLCNYNSHEEDRAQTITLKFDSNVTKVIIYRGGQEREETVSNKTLTISLKTGEGVIVLPSQLG